MIFLHISFSWVEISLRVKFHPPGLTKSGRFMVGDKKNKTTTKQQFHGFNGFLSLQLGLSFELGLRLRLTNRISNPQNKFVDTLSENLQAKTFKENLDAWLHEIPDQPTIPGCQRAAKSNSLLDQVPMMLREFDNP